MIDPKLLEAVSRSDYKGNLIKYLEQVKAEVADVRVGAHSNETRIATIKLIDDLIIGKIRTMTGEVSRNEDEYSSKPAE